MTETDNFKKPNCDEDLLYDSIEYKNIPLNLN